MIKVSVYTRERGTPEWIKYEVATIGEAKTKVKAHDTISAFATYADTGGNAFNFSCGSFRFSQRAETE